jgi:head-tail adaptor
MILDSMLTSSLTVQRQTATADAAGGSERAWTNRGDLPAAIPCRIEPASWHLSRQFARDDATVFYEIFTQVDLAATRQDRVIVDGVTYQVEAYRPQGALAVAGLTVFQTVVSKRN